MNLLFPKLLSLTGISTFKKMPNDTKVLEKDMQHALNNEAFEIYYQPQVNTEGVIHASEALLRWNHPERGFISPGEFIPLAEESRLINQLTDWVIKQICAQLRDWMDRGIAVVPISINLSPIRLMEAGLVEFVKQQLETFSIPGSYLEVEITENSVVKYDKIVLATLKGLNELGIRIAIDDFGTGYSSFEYLREFQADTLKIDQVFIKNMDVTNKKDATIVSSILYLAKGLDMKVVAEGVEEYDQFQFLKQRDCDYLQGYLFSKAVPAADYEKLLRVGYIKPAKTIEKSISKQERRNNNRSKFPFYVHGEITSSTANNKSADFEAIEILIKDISLGGMKVESHTNLEINAAIEYRFDFTIMDEPFDLYGKLRWKREVNENTFYYGVELDLNQNDKNRFTRIIKKLTALKNLNKQQISCTEFTKHE